MTPAAEDGQHPSDSPTITIVCPAFNESRNLQALYSRVRSTLDAAGLSWQLVVVDDRSRDETFQVLASIAKEDRRVTGIRLARNAGAHYALLCGLEFAAGDCAVLMAADLEDPPELIPTMVARWMDGASVVWASRERRVDKGLFYRALARIFHFVTRRVVGISSLPKGGSDFLLLDGHVVDMVRLYRERSANIFALVAWFDLPSATVGYERVARTEGQSGWSWRRRMHLFIGTILGFTNLPIRLLSVGGAAIATLGFVVAIHVFVNALQGSPPQGWTSLMIAVLVIGGVQMIMLGILGEYLWAALDEIRRRPRFLVDAIVGEPEYMKSNRSQAIRSTRPHRFRHNDDER
jgi:dolichol-phosphate mannosyltransferase